MYRMGTPEALEGVRAALSDSNFRVRTAAARAAGMARDRAAVDRLMEMARRDEPPAKRQAAAALGQIGDPRAVPALIAGSAAGAADRFVEHSLIYSLIELKQAAPLVAALGHASADARKTALIALDQLDALTRARLTPFLSEARKDLRAAALWVVSRHPDWSGEVLAFLETRLRAGKFDAAERDGVREALLAFCADPATQTLVASHLNGPQRAFLLDTIDACTINPFPETWVAALGANLDARAIAIVRARGVSSLDPRLEAIANDGAATRELRTAAWSAIIPRQSALPATGFEFLLGGLDVKTDANLRLNTAQALVRAKLSEPQLLSLAANQVPKADALILHGLFDAFRHGRSEAVGLAFVTALRKSAVSIGEPDGRRLEQVLAAYPASVKSAAAPLLERVVAMQRERVERLRKMEPLLTAGGDPGRGRRIFFGEKVACGSCHTIGKQGGHVGPDLTAVGAIRSGHDLLEAIVFPSASFVPGHEIYRVETARETYSGVRGGTGAAGEVVLITGPDSEVRIPRSQVISMKASDVSLMPEGLDESLTRAELTDLLAFLQGQKSRETALAAR
jgi:putative heme-binding domain-containing protein